MPTGMVIMHWDERTGVEILANYPEGISIQEKTLMQLYSQHEFTGEAGMVSLSAGALNLASYYTGPETAIYIILLLTVEEDPDVFEEGLVEISRQILMNVDNSNLAQILPPLYQRLSVYPTLTEEQKYANTFSSEVKRMILTRLREEVAISKSEIAIWLKDVFRESFVDIDSIVISLVKSGLVKVGSVKGVSSDLLFLIEDLAMLRIPATKLIKDPVDHHLPASLKESYLTEVRNFFENYKPSEQDNLKIIEEIMLDPQCYEVLKLLREAMVTRNDLEKLRKKGVDDLDRVLNTLWNNKVIAVFKDDKENEYYCLISDFMVEPIYPEYLINKVRSQYQNKAQNEKVLISALDTLREQYLGMQKAKKQKKSTEKISS